MSPRRVANAASIINSRATPASRSNTSCGAMPGASLCPHATGVRGKVRVAFLLEQLLLGAVTPSTPAPVEVGVVIIRLGQQLFVRVLIERHDAEGRAHVGDSNPSRNRFSRHLVKTSLIGRAGRRKRGKLHVLTQPAPEPDVPRK